MADFKQAIKWLREGKKVHRGKTFYITQGGLFFLFKGKNGDDKIDQRLNLDDINSENWEIYEEEGFCLSDKIEWAEDINKYGCPENQKMIRTEDVKEFIKQEDEIEIQCPVATGSFIEGVIFAKEEIKKARHKLAGKKLT